MSGVCVYVAVKTGRKKTKTSGISDLIRHFWKFLEYFCQMTKICRSCISSKCQMFIACVCLHIICTSSCNKLMHAMYNTNSKHCSNGNNAVSNMSAGNLRLYPRQHHTEPFIRPATFCCLTCSCTYKERQKGGGGVNTVYQHGVFLLLPSLQFHNFIPALKVFHSRDQMFHISLKVFLE